MFFSNKIKPGFVSPKNAFVYTKGAPWGKIFKRSVIVDNEIKFGNLAINEDLVFTKECLSKANHIQYLNECLYDYSYKRNGASLMSRFGRSDDNFELSAFEMIKDFVNNSDWLKELNSLFFLEVLYARCKKNISKKRKLIDMKKEYRELSSFYDKNDDYFKDYCFKYRFAYFAFKILFSCGHHKSPKLDNIN